MSTQTRSQKEPIIIENPNLSLKNILEEDLLEYFEKIFPKEIFLFENGRLKVDLEKKYYSQHEISIFNKMILLKIEKVQEEIKIIEKNMKNPNSCRDTSRKISYIDGADSCGGASDIYLVSQKKFLRDLKNARLRIGNKTYGICHKSKKLINPYRLVLCLHATMSIKSKNGWKN